VSTVDRVTKALISLMWGEGVRDLLRVGGWRGPQGTPVGCPRWTDGGKGLILLGNGCGR
jgi:hypothetical protein